MLHVLEGGQVHRGFTLENLQEKSRLDNLGVSGRVLLKWILKKQEGELCCELYPSDSI